MKRLLQTMALICLVLLAIHLVAAMTYSSESEEQQPDRTIVGYAVVSIGDVSRAEYTWNHYVITQNGDIYEWNDIGRHPAKFVCNIWEGCK